MTGKKYTDAVCWQCADVFNYFTSQSEDKMLNLEDASGDFEK